MIKNEFCRFCSRTFNEISRKGCDRQECSEPEIVEEKVIPFRKAGKG